MLSKPLPDGTSLIPERGEFVADSYYKKFVPETLQIIQVIEEVFTQLPETEAEVADLPDLGEQVAVEEKLEIEVTEATTEEEHLPTPEEEHLPTPEEEHLPIMEEITETPDEPVVGLPGTPGPEGIPDAPGPCGSEQEVSESETTVTEEKPDRVEITDELIRELRIVKGMSYSKIARELGYSLTYIRKRCKKVEAEPNNSEEA